MKSLGKVSKTADGYQVRFERHFHHPIEKVWQAITDPEKMKYWFTDIDMDYREGGKMTVHFRNEAKDISHGKILKIDEPHFFSWSWENELAEWELTAEGNTTHVVLTYSRIERKFATKAPAGVHTLLERLEGALDGKTILYAFGTEESDPEMVRFMAFYFNEVCEALPELDSEQSIVMERTYQAPVQKVWKALTDKDEMKKWYFDLSDFKPEPGFTFQFPGQGQKGEQYMHTCTVLQAIPQKKLQYSWAYIGHPGYSILTFQLFEEGDDATKLRLTHRGLESFPQDKPDFGKASFTAGWTHILTISLQEYLEKA